MYGRARLAQGVARGAILVPQAAVSRNPRGDATVWVVDAQSHAQLRAVTADRTIGDKWLVTRGLSPGERVIVQGLDGLKPGEPVKPVPAGSAPRPGPVA
jgi:membrane fusion protein (multidrug efflux system)